MVNEDTKDRIRAIMRRYIRKNPGLSHEGVVNHLLSLINDVIPFDGVYSISNAANQQIQEGKGNGLEPHAWISKQENGELYMAAANLAMGSPVTDKPSAWFEQIVNINPDRIRQLSLAGAMCAFEIDRMVRYRKDVDGTSTGSSCASGRCSPGKAS